MKTLFQLPAMGLRRPRRWWVSALYVLGAALLLYALPFTLSALSVDYPLAPAPLEGGPRPVRGAFHVHSTRSDGRGTPGEIARAARAAGLDFVVLTDHNLETLPAPEREEGVLLVPGVELSTPDGHLAAVGMPRGLFAAERRSQAVERVVALGGHAFLAHPVQKKNPWRDWTAAQRATGMELYSADSMFRTAWSKPFSRFLPALFAHLVNGPHGLLAIVGREAQVEERLLELGAARPTVAICSHDAHGLPSYESTFRTLSMHLPQERLSDDPVLAAAEVAQGLGSGHAYCVFHALGDGAGFRLEGVPAEGPRVLAVGQQVRVVLPPSTPPEVRLEILGPARLLDDRTVELTGPGAVQVEVWARVPWLMGQEGWRPWLVPSPLQVQAP